MVGRMVCGYEWGVMPDINTKIQNVLVFFFWISILNLFDFYSCNIWIDVIQINTWYSLLVPFEVYVYVYTVYDRYSVSQWVITVYKNGYWYTIRFPMYRFDLTTFGRSNVINNKNNPSSNEIQYKISYQVLKCSNVQNVGD